MSWKPHISSFTHLSLPYQPISRSQAAKIFKESIIVTFSYIKAYVAKVDLVVKYVVNPGSSFEQTMIDPGHLCYIPKFREINPLVPEKIIKAFYHIWARRPSWSWDKNHITLSFLYLKVYIQNSVKNGPVVSEKSMF